MDSTIGLIVIYPLEDLRERVMSDNQIGNNGIAPTHGGVLPNCDFVFEFEYNDQVMSLSCSVLRLVEHSDRADLWNKKRRESVKLFHSNEN